MSNLINDGEKMSYQQPHLTNTRRFVKRLMRNILIGFTIILVSLWIGMWGYHHFEQMTITDSYMNAAMILSGMGPVGPFKTEAGKIFAGTYALFSGIIFLVVMAVVFAPIVHLFLHKFHMEESEK